MAKTCGLGLRASDPAKRLDGAPRGAKVSDPKPGVHGPKPRRPSLASAPAGQVLAEAQSSEPAAVAKLCCSLAAEDAPENLGDLRSKKGEQRATETKVLKGSKPTQLLLSNSYRHIAQCLVLHRGDAFHNCGLRCLQPARLSNGQLWAPHSDFDWRQGVCPNVDDSSRRLARHDPL